MTQTQLYEGHTPGPWVRSYHGYQVLTHDKQVSICELVGSKPRDEQIANAQLIADAPTLLADLVALRQRVQDLEAQLAKAHVDGQLWHDRAMTGWKESDHE